MNAGPSGFASAPVTKVLVLATSSSSLLLQQTLTRRYQANSLLVSSAQLFLFRHLGELAFGTALIYYFRIFERQRGSERHGAFTLASIAATQLTHVVLSACTSWKLHSGPYGLIAANLVSFVADIPPVQRFSMFGLSMSDKALVYAAAGQLFVSAARHSWHSFLAGALTGLAYQADLFGFRRLRVPGGVSRFLGGTIGRLLGSSGQRRRVIMSGSPPMQPPTASSGPPLRRPASQAAPVEASPEALAQLVAMGFDEDRAAAALRQSGNSVQNALSHLL